MQFAEIIQASGIDLSDNVYIGIALGIAGLYFRLLLKKIKDDQDQVGKNVHTAIDAYKGIIDEGFKSIRDRMDKIEADVLDIYEKKNEHRERIVKVEEEIKYITKEHDKNHG